MPVFRFKSSAIRVLLAAAMFLIVAEPAPYVFAQASDGSASDASAQTVCSPAATAPSGIQRPTGSDASTYTYNTCTGLWENTYYTWSPATQGYAPKFRRIYSCDTQSWRWTTNDWVYSPASKSFIQITEDVTALPGEAVIDERSPNPCVHPSAPASPIPAAGTTSSNSGSSAGTTLTNTTTATLQNNLTSDASSGSVSILGNTTAGDASSGNASAVANIINALQSSSSLTGSTVIPFVKDIYGNVQGNVAINIDSIQPATGTIPSSDHSLTTNNQATGSIVNNLNLAAQTGDVTEKQNSQAGNATSGNASAVADVVNLLNSYIAAGQSFVGVVNIHGNLNGNIVVPQQFLDSLLATNAPNTEVSLTPSEAASVGIHNTATTAIANNVTNAATTGAVSENGNTTAGDATSGNADTTVRIFNLTGNQIVAANALLVFVNVSGTWVGMIMNAPQGATAAAFGSGVSQNALSNASVTNTNNSQIANTIGLSAASGNVALADNTTAGTATSGNANTAANLLNLNNTSFSLSGWFGILFINIFGNWYGNFGAIIPTVATIPASPAMGTPAPQPTFSFVPHPHSATISSAPTPYPAPVTDSASNMGYVLGTATHPNAVPASVTTKMTTANSQLLSIVLVIIGLSLFTGERFYARRANR